jgi:hypothetical protein
MTDQQTPPLAESRAALNDVEATRGYDRSDEHRLRADRDRLAAEVGRLTRRVVELEAGLRPFAGSEWVESIPDRQLAVGGPMVRVGDYRRAAALLKPAEET